MTTLSLFPLDPRCTLLTNIVWSPDDNGVPSLHRQKLWVRFPAPITASGLTVEFGRPVGLVRVEFSEDPAGTQWHTLAEGRLTNSPATLDWPAQKLANLRVQVVEPAGSAFPLDYYFQGLQLHVDADELAVLPSQPPVVAIESLEDRSPQVAEPFAGGAGWQANERLGICHERPQTDRLHTTADEETVAFESPVFRMAFSRKQARVTHLSWDAYGSGRQADNLLSTGGMRGAVPVVMRGGWRHSSESGGGSFAHSGRTVSYDDIGPAPELSWNYNFSLREHGFTLELGWSCSATFHTCELAALRIPFDLYASVANVLALPETSGPSGLVSLPLVINAPNHGPMRVTTRDASIPVYGRVIPWRTRGELWLDIMPGVTPLSNGLFTMPEGEGSVTLDFEITKIFPLGNQDKSNLFHWWEMPPFYSLADRENILGALPNAWLTGLSFRPDLGRFANNSVADSAASCSIYYADIAAYTPVLAPGLDPRQLIRFAAEQLLRDTATDAEYSNWKHAPTAATAPIELAWLYVASSGDWDWAKRWREPLRFYAATVRQLEFQGSGLVASDFSGIPEQGSYMAACWCDSIRSGHLESYLNAHVYRGLNRAADLLDRLDDVAGAAAALAMAARLKASFLPTFHDAGTKRIVQWVAQDGRRFGFDSHMHLGAAIALGLIPREPARELLAGYLGRLADSGFTHYEWGLPIFLDPVPADCHNPWKGRGIDPDGTDQVGVYMNGAIHSHQTYYILQALYEVGMRREANDLFMKMTPLVRQGSLCGGLHSGLDWRHPTDGRPSGYEGLLAEQFHFLLAAITGYLGCRLTIDGLVIDGPDSQRIRDLRPNFARMAEGT